MARVSIIMPVRNPGRFLEPAVKSVLSQTFEDWELFVVDDGSEPPVVVPDLPKIRLLRQPPRGVGAARNLAIMSSDSEYIAFLDGDDLWLPEKLTVQIAALDKDPSAGLCFADRHVIDDADNMMSSGSDSKSMVAVEHCNPKSGNAAILHTVSTSRIVTSSVVIRRDTLPLSGMFDPLLRFGEDYDMWFKIARGFKILRLDYSLVLYRWHDANSLRSYRTVPLHEMDSYHKQQAWALMTDDVEAEKVIKSRLSTVTHVHAVRAFDYAREALRRGDWVESFSHLSWVAAHHPAYLLKSLRLFAQKQTNNRGKHSSD